MIKVIGSWTLLSIYVRLGISTACSSEVMQRSGTVLRLTDIKFPNSLSCSLLEHLSRSACACLSPENIANHASLFRQTYFYVKGQQVRLGRKLISWTLQLFSGRWTGIIEGNQQPHNKPGSTSPFKQWIRNNWSVKALKIFTYIRTKWQAFPNIF